MKQPSQPWYTHGVGKRNRGVATITTHLRIVTVILSVAVTSSMGTMEIWGGVNGNNVNDASLPFKDLIWQYPEGWQWALSSDSGNTRPGFFGGVDRYPWPIEEVPRDEIKANCPLDENNFPTQVPFTYGGRDYRPVWMFNWFMPEIVYPFGTYTLIAEGTGRIDFGWNKDTTIYLTGGKTVVHFNIDSIPEIDKLTDETFNAMTGVKSSGLAMTIVESDPDDHVRNIHLIRPDPLGGASWADDFETCPFNPQWLEDMRIFKVLRFMDWNRANDNGLVHWEDRITPTRFPANDHLVEHAPYLTMERISANHIPYEFQIEAVNAIGCDYWLNVPARADEDYVRNLAQLCGDRLNPGIKVYLEWANETWNQMFIGLHSTDFVRDNYNSNVSDLFQAHAYMAARNTAIFREVLGSDRVVGVIAGQAGNSGVGSNIISALGNAAINPNSVPMDAYAVTGYFGVGGPDRGANQAAKNNANSAGLRLLMYEGGTEHGRSPAMYDLISDALTVFDQDGFDNFNAFVAVSGWGDFGDWGFMQYAGQPLEDAHKYRALYDWAVSHGQFDPNSPIPTCEGANTVRPDEYSTRPAIRVAPAADRRARARYTLHGQRVPYSETVRGASGIVIERTHAGAAVKALVEP